MTSEKSSGPPRPFELAAEVDANGRSNVSLETQDLSASVAETLAAPGGQSRPLSAVQDSIEPGMIIGPWRVEGLIGEGGMGRVYKASRADGAFELTVALKLLKRGMDSDAVLSRFLRERRILARLSDPNIARLIDAGVAPDGRPYLVMELVEGQRINEYAYSKGLGVTEIVKLLMTVCQAVQTAHAIGVVHRDLKPSNVLVNAQGQVKLLDFGIAKLLSNDQSDATLLQAGAMPMTPAYAAPEQLMGQATLPTADVFSLGIIAFELLVGRRPFSADRNKRSAGRSLYESAVAPSTALTLARGHIEEPLRLLRQKELTRDVDLIVLKALHPEPGMRYGCAGDLGDDLNRMLMRQPVLARPDSLAYRVDRFVKRHRTLVIATAAVVLSLAIGMTVAIWQAGVAIAARNEANSRRAEANDLISFMLGGLKDELEPIGKLAILDKTVEKAYHYLQPQPAGVAPDMDQLLDRSRALISITDIRRLQSQMDPAVESGLAAVASARQWLALKPTDPDARLTLADALRALADPLEQQGKGDLALPLLEEGSKLGSALESDPQYATQARLLGADLDDLKGAVRLRQQDYHQASAAFGACAERLAALVGQAGAPSAASRQYLSCESSLASAMSLDGHQDQSLQLYQTILADTPRLLGAHPEDTRLLETVQNMADGAVGAFYRVGQMQQAATLAAQAVSLGRELFAIDPSNLSWLEDLAAAQMWQSNVAVKLSDWASGLVAASDAIEAYKKLLEKNRGDLLLRQRLMGLYATRANIHFLGYHDVAATLDDYEAEIALNQGTQPPNIVFYSLHARLNAWERGQDQYPERAEVNKQQALQQIAEFEAKAAANALSAADLLVLKTIQMKAAYLQGDSARGDTLYLDLKDHKYFDMGVMTDIRHRLCDRLNKHHGPQCGAIAEWQPAS